VIPVVRSFTVVPTGAVMRSTSVWVVLLTVDGVLKPTVGSRDNAGVDGKGFEEIKVCTSRESCAASAEAWTTSSVFSVSSAEESASVSDDFFAR
jgi:hypothetical protein